MNAPRDSNEAALMNARKKEKKKIIQEGKKPTCPSEWNDLGKKWYDWVKANEWSIDIHDFANAHGYPPYRFKKDWAKESPIFREYLEKCLYLTHSRRNKYMDSREKLYLQILKQLPQYDWEYKDIEDERIFKESLADEIKWSAIIAPVKQTEKLDEFIKKQKEKK